MDLEVILGIHSEIFLYRLIRSRTIWFLRIFLPQSTIMVHMHCFLNALNGDIYNFSFSILNGQLPQRTTILRGETFPETVLVVETKMILTLVEYQ